MIDVPDTHRDLLESSVASLATIGPDGRPQLTVVWFLYDNDEVALSLNVTRQKTKNLVARPQCSLLILDPGVPERYLEIRGDVEVTPDDGSFIEKVGKKYHTDLRAYDAPNDERVVVRIVPTRVNAVDMRG
ncbi:MAG TPA: PPOX class F420-dependent oxidoreductase [Acidimicrobiales bacterium]|nr:PPOX class F420-dependent oxidoreductase [Acidimicrobiales bacterium]